MGLVYQSDVYHLKLTFKTCSPWYENNSRIIFIIKSVLARTGSVGWSKMLWLWVYALSG